MTNLKHLDASPSSAHQMQSSEGEAWVHSFFGSTSPQASLEWPTSTNLWCSSPSAQSFPGSELESGFDRQDNGAGLPLCECARFGKRALSWAFWIPGFSGSKSNGTLDRRNLEFSHEHIKFDASGDNIGFGQHGLFQEDLSHYSYEWQAECYDGSLVRKAIARMGLQKPYNFITNNCQDFAASVRGVYQRIFGSAERPQS